jgi:16S rRNA (guanine527-N7)-methyltransferase
MARLNLYESALKLWQPSINLVAGRSLDDVWHRHFADSAQLAALIPATARRLVDLGSGGGFPGLVLAIVLSERLHGDCAGAYGTGVRVTLVESDTRKAAFLREVARQTGTAVEILSTRIENPETQVKLGTADVVTARALAPIERLLGLAAPLFGPDTVGLFPKGRTVAAEIEAARALWAFDVSLVSSVTADDAKIAVIRQLRRAHEA